MNIYIAQLNPKVGDMDGNLDKIREAVASASTQEADLIIFPELMLTGYPPRDLLTYSSFLDHIDSRLKLLIAESKKYPELTIVIGTPFKENEFLYNSACVIHAGAITTVQHKTHLPTYDVFDETRYFKSGSSHHFFTCKNKRLGIIICEDAWQDEELHQKGYSTYSQHPIANCMSHNCEMIIAISASPFELEKAQKRRDIFVSHAKKHQVPIVVVNQVGANDQLIFDGGSFMLNAKGEAVWQAPQFEESCQLVKWDSKLPSQSFNFEEPEEQLYKALVLGIRDYVHKTGFRKVVIGLSGGIDSAVTAALAVKALGNNQVIGVSMPSAFSSEGSKTDAKELASNMKFLCKEIPISSMYDHYITLLDPHFREYEADETEENIQARIRGVLLMALANKYQALVLNTGNKSELAMGYCTLYGDMCGALSVLADVPKTWVYKLAHYINREDTRIPLNSIQKPPSAELRPNQKDSDSLPDYEYLDNLLEAYIEKGQSLDQLIKSFNNSELIKTIIARVNANEYKRQQSALPLKVTSKAFGMGRRMPIAAKFSI